MPTVKVVMERVVRSKFIMEVGDDEAITTEVIDARCLLPYKEDEVIESNVESIKFVDEAEHARLKRKYGLFCHEGDDPVNEEVDAFNASLTEELAVARGGRDEDFDSAMRGGRDEDFDSAMRDVAANLIYSFNKEPAGPSHLDYIDLDLSENLDADEAAEQQLFADFDKALAEALAAEDEATWGKPDDKDSGKPETEIIIELGGSPEALAEVLAAQEKVWEKLDDALAGFMDVHVIVSKKK